MTLAVDVRKKKANERPTRRRQTAQKWRMLTKMAGVLIDKTAGAAINKTAMDDDVTRGVGKGTGNNQRCGCFRSFPPDLDWTRNERQRRCGWCHLIAVEFVDERRK
jgi:hypothetical protein